MVADALRQAGCELVLGKPLDDFREFRYERKDLVKLIGDAPIVFPAGRDFIGADILDSCPDLQAVVKSSIGIETVDVDAATDLGIICCNSPTPENYLGVAEATVGLMVALFKRLKRNEAHMRTQGWKEARNHGVLMLGKTVGIIGVGRVGQNVAKRLAGWGMKILAYDPYVKQEKVADLGVKMVALEELLRAGRCRDPPCGLDPRDPRHARSGAVEVDEAQRLSHQHLARPGDQGSRLDSKL